MTNSSLVFILIFILIFIKNETVLFYHLLFICYECYLKEDEERITDFWRKNHPLHLVKSVPVEDLKKVRYYIDCGDDDYLYKGNSLLHITMRELEIPHEFRVRDGAHTWSYWHQGLKDGLAFLTEGFR